MRIARITAWTAAVVPLLQTLAVAQTNEFLIWPERNLSSVTFTSRPGVGAVEVFQEVPGTLFAGVGDGTAGCQVTGISFWGVDENPSTPEPYHIIIRKPDATGRVDPTAAGLVMRAGPFNTPVGGTVRASVRITATFSAPVTIPCRGGFFMGVDLAASPTWPTTDGLSIWDARYSPPATRLVGDNPRLAAPQHVWAVMGGSVTGPFDWVHHISVQTGAPLLNMGGIDPANTRHTPAGSAGYGAAGMYPDISGNPRSDGLEARIENLATTSGVAMLLLSTGITTLTEIPVAGVEGHLWLDVRLLITMGAGPVTSGVGIIPVAGAGVISTALVGATVAFQALVIDTANRRIAFTNAQGVSF
jgi:hypothetical protein